MTQRAQKTREALIRATIEAIAQSGVGAITVRDIASKAGANVAAVSYHFGSKDRLVALAIQSTRAHMLEDVAAVASGQRSASEALGDVPEGEGLRPTSLRARVQEALRYLAEGCARYPGVLEASLGPEGEAGESLEPVVMAASSSLAAEPELRAKLARRLRPALAAILFSSVHPHLLGPPASLLDAVVDGVLEPGEPTR